MKRSTPTKKAVVVDLVKQAQDETGHKSPVWKCESYCCQVECAECHGWHPLLDTGFHPKGGYICGPCRCELGLAG